MPRNQTGAGEPGRRGISRCFPTLVDKDVPEGVWRDGTRNAHHSQVVHGLELTCTLAAKTLLSEGLGTGRGCPLLPLLCDTLPPLP